MRKLNRLDKLNFKIYDVTVWETNDGNTHTAQNFKK